MSDFEMTDFEARFERRLQRHAEIPVAAIDATVVAREVVSGGRRRTVAERLGFGARPLGMPALAQVMLVVILGLILAVALAVFVGSGLRGFPVKPPLGRNGLIAYQVSDITERPYNHVHVMNADGSNDREVAQGSAPSYSRDGKTLAYFTGFGAGEPDLRLWVADSGGSNMREVSTYNQRGLDLSPDGTQFLVIADGDGLLDFGPPGAMGLISVADGSVRLLVDPPVESERFWEEHWSPDGKSIAYAVTRDVTNGDNGGSLRDRIDIVDVETGEVRTLTHRLGTDGIGIAWSPDSQQIAYNGLPDGSPAPSLGDGSGSTDSFYPQQDVFVINADGSNDRNITNSPESESNVPQWSPDGRSVAYLNYREGPGVQIDVSEVDGPAPNEPRHGPNADWFVFSPDGDLVLYSRSVEGPPTADGQQQFTSTILTIDSAFTQDPVTLASPDFMVGWLNWQWLEP